MTFSWDLEMGGGVRTDNATVVVDWASGVDGQYRSLNSSSIAAIIDCDGSVGAC